MGRHTKISSEMLPQFFLAIIYFVISQMVYEIHRCEFSGINSLQLRQCTDKLTCFCIQVVTFHSVYVRKKK